MAQISQGTRLRYSLDKGSTWVDIPDVKSIPALGSTPNTQQTTTLTDTMHTYIEGLVDVGGALEFTANYTPALLDKETIILGAQGADKTIHFCVEFDKPLNKRIKWEGRMAPVYNTDVSVDAVVEATIAIVPYSALTTENIA